MARLFRGAFFIILMSLLGAFAHSDPYHVRIKGIQGNVFTFTSLDSNLEVVVQTVYEDDFWYFWFRAHGTFDISFSCLPMSGLGCDEPLRVRVGGRPTRLISWKLCKNVYEAAAYEDMSFAREGRIVEGVLDGNRYGYLIQARCGAKYVIFQTAAYSERESLGLPLRRGDSVEVEFSEYDPRNVIVNQERMRLMGIIFSEEKLFLLAPSN